MDKDNPVKYRIGDLVKRKSIIHDDANAVVGLSIDNQTQRRSSSVKYSVSDLVKRNSIAQYESTSMSSNTDEQRRRSSSSSSSPVLGDLVKRNSLNTRDLSKKSMDINDSNSIKQSPKSSDSVLKEEPLTWRDMVSDNTSPRASIKYSPADLVKRKSLKVDTDIATTSSTTNTPVSDKSTTKEGWFSSLKLGISFSRSRSASKVSAPDNNNNEDDDDDDDDDTQSNNSDVSSKISKDSDMDDENTENVNNEARLRGEGLMGFLHRVKEKNDKQNEKEYIKCWAELHSHKLMYTYSDTIPSSTIMAKGFITIDKNTEVNLKFHVYSSGILEKEQYFFTVRHSDVATTFCVNTELERDKWVLIIRNCIEKFSLVKPEKSKLITELHHLDQQHHHHAELPRKVGMLMKRALGGKMTARVGFTSNKKRWFRLDGGVLMYYNDKDMRPSKLKGTISLENSTLLNDDDNPMAVRVELQDGKILHCEADTTKAANEWKAALSESIEGLQKVQSHTAQRRVNVADQSTDDNDSVPQLPSGLKKPQKSLNAIKSCLSKHFLLQSIQDYDEIIDALKQEIFYPNDVIIYQGVPGSTFFITEAGDADILKDGQLVGKVKAGSTFGELALLNSVTRTATVKANDVCHMWSLERESFRYILRKQEEKVALEKLELLNKISFFDQIGIEGKKKICNNLYLSTFSIGQKIFKQGDKGDAFYIIISGSVSLLQSTMFGSTNELIKLKPNSFFGEKALLEDAPRAATAIALSTTTCWTIDKSSFTTIFGSMKEALSEALATDALKNVNILKSLSNKQLNVIARSLSSMTFQNDEVIIEQGEDGNTFYIIQTGEVAVQVNHIEVAKLGIGSFFGELALLKNEKRNATVIARGVTSCLVMKREEFNNLLGPLESIINNESKKQRDISSTEKNLLSMAFSMTRRVVNNNFNAKAPTASSPKPSEYTHNSFQLSSLNPIKLLKKGTFSTVYLAQNVTGRYFALKVMQKKAIYDLNLMTAIYREREILRCVDHPFIVQFYATISDVNSLYLVEKYIEGTDFYDYLIEKKNYLTLSSNSRKFYTANILSIITYLFEEDIVYRDLKPENLVIDSQGYLILVDFGCAKKLPQGVLTNTMCGCPEYLAPELVLSKGHSRAVDLWGFGVLLYELVKGYTPFTPHDCHGNLTIIYQNILHSKDVLSRNETFQSFDKSMIPLVKDLLNDNPYMRMGMLRNGIKEIWNHPFLTGYDQTKIYHRSLTAPYNPSEHIDSIDAIFIYEDINIEEAPEYTGTYDFSTF